jgi:hypothetical protein
MNVTQQVSTELDAMQNLDEQINLSTHHGSLDAPEEEEKGENVTST